MFSLIHNTSVLKAGHSSCFFPIKKGPTLGLFFNTRLREFTEFTALHDKSTAVLVCKNVFSGSRASETSPAGSFAENVAPINASYGGSIKAPHVSDEALARLFY